MRKKKLYSFIFGKKLWPKWPKGQFSNDLFFYSIFYLSMQNIPFWPTKLPLINLYININGQDSVKFNPEVGKTLLLKFQNEVKASAEESILTTYMVVSVHS